MNAAPEAEPLAPVDRPPSAAAIVPASTVPSPETTASKPLITALALVALAALISSGLLWQKLGTMQEMLAHQSADAAAQATAARATSVEAQALARETAARVAVFDARLSEISLQRSQLEELMQSLSRSRDENLVVDIESALRLAQQQAQLTGSVEPLLAALKSADQRVARAAQPRLSRLQRAIVKDMDRIRSATVSDTPGLLNKLDELVRLTDELPLVNAVASVASMGAQDGLPLITDTSWLQRALRRVLDEARGLVRVSRVEQPEAVLLSPEQSFFLRENFKLKLLNARLGLLARQTESARSDLVAATGALYKYFDPSSRKTQTASALIQQVLVQMRNLQLPRVDETLAALATAAAGK